jgi:hypothetical protein
VCAGFSAAVVAVSVGGAALISRSPAASASTMPLNWVKLTPKMVPTARTDTSMAYDRATGQLILFGGASQHGRRLSTTWEWNGRTWLKLTPRTKPPGRTFASMAYDTATGQLILFGGSGAHGALFTTWEWNGRTWVKLAPARSPTASGKGSMAYDAATGQLILFGGVTTSHPFTYPSATWEWNGRTWVKLTPATKPPGRTSASMAYDTATGQLVLFGGTGPGSTHPTGTDERATTWEWNGTTWVKLTPTTIPTGLTNAPMAYDTATGQLVLFGGWGPFFSLSDATCEWNGTTWVKLAPAKSPRALEGASMAYDPATNQLVLFGGAAYQLPLSTTWALVPTTPRVASKRAAALTGISCSAASACTAVGDYYSYSEAPLRYGSFVLRWNGTAWHRQRAPAIGPATLATVAVSCATARRCVAVGASGAMVWVGTRWKSKRGVTGDAVSCPSAKLCVAVGSRGQGLVSETWRDGMWTSEEMPLPTAPVPIQSITLSGVSCASVRFCMAVGDYVYGTSAVPSPSRRVLTLAEVWNGEAWRLVPPNNPATLASPKAVSCRSARFCLAVGTQRTQFTLAQLWTGTGWKVQMSPNPSSVGYSALDAVACPTAHICEA